MPITQAKELVMNMRFGELLAYDQLGLMRRDGMAFDGFDEQKIAFLPSYKWRVHQDELDMRSQKHVPAWTDRILYKSMARPVACSYRYSIDLSLKQSDHRPVFACFSLAMSDVKEKEITSVGSSAEETSPTTFPTTRPTPQGGLNLEAVTVSSRASDWRTGAP